MTTETVTINTDQRLYVIEHKNGYTCQGFDYAFGKAKAVAAWAGLLPPRTENIGTQQDYAEQEEIVHLAADYALRTNRRCDAELTPQLIGLEGRRVEVVDKYGERRRFQVGKSTGWMPIHLEIARRNCHGGPAVTGAPFRSVKIVR